MSNKKPTCALKTVTEKMAKDYLGWKEVGEDDSYLLTDTDKKKIRCTNNEPNRPFVHGLMESYCQEVMNQRWRLNGETIIFGTSGRLLSGQHRLIGLVVACQKFRAGEKGKWKTAPVLETFVVHGIEEDPETTSTIENVRPRSLADVLFTDVNLFGKKTSEADRKRLAKMTANAVNEVWERTASGEQTFLAKKTHAEEIDFIRRHPKLLEAVKFIDGENGANMVGRFVNPGTAAALLYLMGSSDTDGKEYRASTVRTEKKFDWKYWEKAEEFWTCLAKEEDSMKPLTRAKSAYKQRGDDGNEVTVYAFPLAESKKDKVAVIVQAWNEFAAGNKLTEKNLTLNYSFDTKYNRRVLHDNPVCGGIDVGYNWKPDDEEGADDDTEEFVPSPQEVERVKAEVRKEKAVVPSEDKHQKNVDMLTELREQHPGVVLAFQTGDKFKFVGQDAVTVKAVARGKFEKLKTGIEALTLGSKTYQTFLDSVKSKAHQGIDRLAVVQPGDNGGIGNVVYVHGEATPE
jgi:hypothetical protein